MCDTCGDGICNPDDGESCATCATDCACGACGDGMCDFFGGETQFNCPGDCACGSGACGGSAPGACWCDNACLFFNDCCWDACQECGHCA